MVNSARRKTVSEQSDFGLALIIQALPGGELAGWSISPELHAGACAEFLRRIEGVESMKDWALVAQNIALGETPRGIWHWWNPSLPPMPPVR